MRKLSKVEKKIFDFLTKETSGLSHTNARDKSFEILKNYFGFNKTESSKIYQLWYYTVGEDLEVYDVSDEGELYEFINRISLLGSNQIDELTDELYVNKREYLEKIFGDYFNINCGGWNSTTPCISFDSEGAQIELNRDQWEKYFSGVHVEDMWIYYIAFNNYSDFYEDVSEDEFDYVMYNDETIRHLETIAILTGKNDWPGKDGKHIDNEEIKDFLSDTLPTRLFDNILNEYISEMSIALTRTKRDAISEEYEKEIKYDTNKTRCSTGDYCIHIPYDDLLEIIKEKNLINLSDLKDVEVNPLIDLGGVYSDTWIDDENTDEVLRSLNNYLQNSIDEISEDENLMELIDERRKVQEMLDKLGFVLVTKTNNKGLWYKSKDGKIELYTNDINFENKKIKFTYEGKSHMVPFDEFPNWVQGSVLDLNENVKIRKKILNEDINDITKISIFDFDGTLMKTPHPEEGKKEWEEKTKKTYPHIGWWSKPESLDIEVFDIKPISSTIESYKKEMKNPNTLVIMLTGRIPKQSEQIESLLSSFKIVFDEYHYKGNGDTLNSKINTIKTLLNRFPNVREIEMWEDREPHAISFEEWGIENDIPVKVNLVKSDIDGDFIFESEDKKNNFFKRISSIITTPLIRDLESLGVTDKEEIEKVLSLFFNQKVKMVENCDSENNCDVIITNENDSEIYFEGYRTDIWEMKEYDKDGNLILFNDSDGNWKKYTHTPYGRSWVDSRGNEGSINYRLDESSDKHIKFYQKMSSILNPPYFINLQNYGVPFKEWKPILELIYKQYIILDGETQSKTSIVDITGKRLYSEWTNGDWVDFINDTEYFGVHHIGLG